MDRMDGKLNIIYLEDNIKDAEIANNEFNETMKFLIEQGFREKIGFGEINMIRIPGSDHMQERGKVYQFYIENDFKEIDKLIKEFSNNEERIGILMDVILAKEEQERAKINDFSRIQFSKRVFEKYERDYGIYIITSLRNFGSRAWGIYGYEGLINRYIPKALVDACPSRKAMAKALYWMYYRKQMEPELADEIEECELKQKGSI